MSVGSLKRLHRLSAVVAIFCYIWLSAAGAFLHHCVHVHPSSNRVAVTVAGTDSRQVADGSQVVEHVHANGANSCAACEWQTVNVSVALPVFEVVPPFSLQQRVITTFPRYLRTTFVSTVSRAPPHA